MFDDLRAAWGAAPATNPVTVAISKRTELFAHWNGPAAKCPPESDHQRCLDFVKAVQKYHQETRGWSDVGYNGFVCQHGRAIEGRGVDIQAAHCPDHNVTGIGIQVTIGEGETATPEALSRFARLRSDIEAHVGRQLTPQGHRDGAATTCPGDQVYAWVGEGMPDPLQEETMTTQQYDAIMAALADLSKSVASMRVEVSAAKSAASSAKTATDGVAGALATHEKNDADRTAALTGRVEAAVSGTATNGAVLSDLGVELPFRAAEAVKAAINESLGGVEVTARYTRTNG